MFAGSLARVSLYCHHRVTNPCFGHGCPVSALKGQMLAVLEQAPAECAAKQRVAVAINAPRKVLARHANPCSPEGDEIPLVYPGPFLHRSSASTDVLTGVCWGMQGCCASPTPISLAG